MRRGGTEKNVFYSDWKGKYVQGQSWVVLVEKIICKNLEHINNALHGGYDFELPPLKPWFDSLEKPNLFSLIATKLVRENDGGGDHEVVCR